MDKEGKINKYLIEDIPHQENKDPNIFWNKKNE